MKIYNGHVFYADDALKWNFPETFFFALLSAHEDQSYSVSALEAEAGTSKDRQTERASMSRWEIRKFYLCAIPDFETFPIINIAR